MVAAGYRKPQTHHHRRKPAGNFTNEGGLDGSIRFLTIYVACGSLSAAARSLGDALEDVAALAALYLESDCPSIINPDPLALHIPTSMTKAIAALAAAHIAARASEARRLYPLIPRVSPAQSPSFKVASGHARQDVARGHQAPRT